MSAKNEVLQLCRCASLLLICACNGEIGTRSSQAGGRAGTNAGGNAGSAMSGPGGTSSGSGGSMSEPDAGGEAGSAGSAGSGNGGGGAYEYPDDCPPINPIPVEGQQIAVQSVNFDTSEVVFKNVSSQDVTIVGGERGWQWCNFPDYDRLLQEDLTLEPGQTVATLIVGRFAVRTLERGTQGDPNELAFYTTTGSFMTADLMAAFVSWGAGYGGGRENVAAMALLWTYGDRIPIAPGHSGFVATGATDTGDGYTSVDAHCLVAPPNPPGTVIPEPLPETQ